MLYWNKHVLQGSGERMEKIFKWIYKKEEDEIEGINNISNCEVYIWVDSIGKEEGWWNVRHKREDAHKYIWGRGLTDSEDGSIYS